MRDSLESSGQSHVSVRMGLDHFQPVVQGAGKEASEKPAHLNCLGAQRFNAEGRSNSGAGVSLKLRDQ